MEKDLNFSDAFCVREKINELRILEHYRAKDELIRIHNEEINYIENEKLKEIENFNEFHDNTYNELNSKFEELKLYLKQQHSEEYKEVLDALNQQFPETNPKVL